MRNTPQYSEWTIQSISLIFGILNKYNDRTLSPIWKGISTSSVRNLRRMQLALREEQLYAECAVILMNFYSSNLLSICPSLFEINLNKAKYSIYEKLSRVLSVVGDGMLALCLYLCVNFYKCFNVAFSGYDMTSILCSEFYSHDCLQTCRYKTSKRALRLIFWS